MLDLSLERPLCWTPYGTGSVEPLDAPNLAAPLAEPALCRTDPCRTPRWTGSLLDPLLDRPLLDWFFIGHSVDQLFQLENGDLF